MADRAKKITELPIVTTFLGDDIIPLVSNTAANAVTVAISTRNLLAGFSSAGTIRANYIRSTAAPVSSSSTGVAGEIRYDQNYIYVCVTTNTWKRVALSTW